MSDSKLLKYRIWQDGLIDGAGVILRTIQIVTFPCHSRVMRLPMIMHIISIWQDGLINGGVDHSENCTKKRIGATA
jgi:hypothetical protein